MASGKSTIGSLVARQLARTHIELDDHRWRYYDEIGFDHELARTLHARGDTRAILDYSKPFEVHAVERAMQEFPGAVVSFGAGHSVHAVADHAMRVRVALEDWFVALLEPSADRDRSLAVLDSRLARIEGFPLELGHELNRAYLTADSNASLATETFFTDHRSPAEVAASLSQAYLHAETRTPRLREAVRVLLVDDQERVLLFQTRNPRSGRTFWFAAGGGLEDGETDVEAARREVAEETGLMLEQLGEPIWNRRHVFDWDRALIDVRERWYVARVPSFEIETGGWTDTERAGLTAHRWWTLEELHATDEHLAPRSLAHHLEHLLADGPPSAPIDIGV